MRMAIKVTCPVTGANFTMSAFKGELRAISRHPVLSLSLPELNAIELGNSPTDNYLLLCGYLAELERQKVLRIRAPLRLSEFDSRWIQQQLPNITRLTNWLALNHASQIKNRIPHFVLDATNGRLELQTWCLESLGIIDNLSFAWTLSAKNTNAKNNFMKLLAATEHGDSYHEPEVTRKTPAAIQARGFAKYVQRSFEISSMLPQVYQQVRSVVIKPGEYPVSTLRKVRALIMEIGLESTIADINDKELICAAIDKVLIEKCGILSMLDAATQDDLDDIESIRAGYTILIDGVAHTNSAVPAAQADAKLNGATCPTIVLGPEPEVSSELPVESDYANRALYLAALSRYNRARRNS